MTWARRRPGTKGPTIRNRLQATVALALLLGAGAAASAPELTWMYGLQGPPGLQMAKRMGLSALAVPTTNAVESVEDTRRLATLARAAGLQVIVVLPTYSSRNAADPADAAYREAVGGRMRAVVRQLAGEEGIVAWAMGDYPERELRTSPAAFRSSLEARQASLEDLNRVWGSSLATWAQVSPETVRETDQDMPHGVGRASVDWADFQASALRDLLLFWAEQVRSVDQTRPLLTGRLSLYRSLLSVPEAYTYVVPEMPVDVVERDLLTQNVQAVDIARQGGAFEVIPSLRVPVPPEEHYDAGRTLARWLQEARLHGARGVALDGLPRVQGCSAPDLVQRDLEKQLPGLLGDFAVRPRASLCVLLEPYAEGQQVMEVPLYGYLAGLAPGEPAVLAAALRLGSKYGLADYLSPERAVHADLERYSAVLAPTALRLPLELQARLRGYVERGGRLVCDLGAGMYESGSWLQLTPELGRTLGVASLSDLADRRGNLHLVAATPLLPDLRPPMRSRGLPTQEEKSATSSPLERLRFTVVGPSVLALPESGAKLVLGLAMLGDGGAPAPPPSPEGPAPATLPAARPIAGVLAQQRGLGWAAFFTGTLWANWDPADPLFQGFHEAVWAPRAPCMLRQPGLWPAGLEFCVGEDGLYLLNTTGRDLMPEVAMVGAEGDLLEGAYTRMLPQAWVASTGGVTYVALEVPRGALLAASRRPVRVSPVVTEASACLRSYGAGEIRLEVAGAGARLSRELSHAWVFQGGKDLHAEVRVTDGAYAVVPQSWHELTVQPRRGAPTSHQLRADAAGQLSFQVVGQDALLRLRPVGGGL